jgi:hypothetical protein
MALKFSFENIEGDFGDLINGYFDPIKIAATGAITDVAEIAKTQGRADIARAGFSPKWQNALRANVYPKKGFSADAAAWIFHRIPYAGVFEDGATIRGRPRMWIPLSSTPKLGGRTRLTPKNFEKQYGRLVPMNAGRNPLLGAPVGLTRAEARGGPPYRISPGTLRRGASGSGIIRTVPVFVGVDVVSIRKRFNLRRIFNDAAARLPQLYLDNLET